MNWVLVAMFSSTFLKAAIPLLKSAMTPILEAQYYYFFFNFQKYW